MSHFFVILLTFISSICCNPSQASNKRPNILFILFDDLGWNDVSVHGGIYPTPNIDSLTTNGIELLRHYSHLICSVSRSQYLTGRYAMYYGQGKVDIFPGYALGGIPIGLPLISNLLKKYGQYKTYAIGKWHVGYAIDDYLPQKRGFDHFFGFYTGMMSYSSFKSHDVPTYDIHEDGKNYNFQQMAETNLAKELEQSDHSLNAMYFFKDKGVKYLNQIVSEQQNDALPFYIYFAMPSPHGPLPDIAEYAQKCKKILKMAYKSNDIDNEEMVQRMRYCEIMLLSDDVIGAMVNSLKSNGLYDETLIVMASDNGGALENMGCNYPLRGTKGTMFEGNTRTFSVVSGGVISSKQFGTKRHSLMSSLDWTPTLLQFADISVRDEDVSWNGLSAYDMIMHGDDYSVRDHIVFNIGLRNLNSAAIVYEFEGKLLKYIASDKDVEQRMFKSDFNRNWCVPNSKNAQKDDEIYFINDSKDELNDFPNAFDERYWLFNLDEDESENFNLLKTQNDDFSNENAIKYAKNLMLAYLDNLYWSQPMNELFESMQITPQSYELFSDSFTTSFLTHDQFLQNMNDLMDKEQNENDNSLSNEFRTMYTQKWISAMDENEENVFMDGVKMRKVPLSNVWMYSIVFVFVLWMLCISKVCSRKKTNVFVKYGAVNSV